MIGYYPISTPSVSGIFEHGLNAFMLRSQLLLAFIGFAPDVCGVHSPLKDDNHAKSLKPNQRSHCARPILKGGRNGNEATEDGDESVAGSRGLILMTVAGRLLHSDSLDGDQKIRCRTNPGLTNE